MYCVQVGDRSEKNLRELDGKEVLEGRPHSGLEQIYAKSYVEDGVLFDDHCLNVMGTPEDINWGPMHVLFTSGGVAQLHCNGFINK